eukprot:Skav217759  [mRNA]  locus=scaffold974:151187:153334:+ [translate_table: standard]
MRHSDPKRFGIERQRLFLSVHQPEPWAWQGVFEMMQQFDQEAFVTNTIFLQQGDVLNQLLFADEIAEAVKEPKESGKNRAPKSGPVKDVEVIVRHAVEEDHPPDEEVRIVVKSNATMRTVKEALIKHLGKPDLLQTCRLVQRAGENSAFSGFKATQKAAAGQ